MSNVTKQHEKLIVEISINGIHVIDGNSSRKKNQINNRNPNKTTNNFSPLSKWHHIIFQKLNKKNAPKRSTLIEDDRERERD